MITKRRILFLVIIGIVYYFFGSGSNNNKKASEALIDVLEYADHLYTIESKLQELLSNKEYDLLISNYVKPAQDEIASIRKQTIIYENMERIPGGPQNFMETSSAVLDKMRNDVFMWEKQYRLSTARHGKKWNAIASEIDNCDRRLAYLDEVQPSLATLQIYISPVEEDMEPLTGPPQPLNRIITLMRNKVLPLLIEFENIKIEKSWPPYFDAEDVYKMELFEVLKSLQMVIETYRQYFEQVGRLLIDKLHDIKKMTYDIEKMDWSKVKYEELAVGIDNDITALKEKITNLKYPKKKTDEL